MDKDDNFLPQVEIDLNQMGLGFVIVDGEIIPGSFAVEFVSTVGDVPQVTIKQYCRAKVSLEANVTVVSICPNCKQELDRQIKNGSSTLGSCDATAHHDPVKVLLVAPEKKS